MHEWWEGGFEHFSKLTAFFCFWGDGIRMHVGSVATEALLVGGGWRGGLVFVLYN